LSQVFVCSHCGTQADALTWIWRCAKCGAPLDFAGEPVAADLISLGEPETPLVEIELGRLTVTAKLEGALPTGSFKDRGSRVVVSALRAYGSERAVIDSSGNAGASLAAYCARAGLHCDVYAPASASPGKLAQMRAFGARIHAVPGTRQDVADAAIAAAESAAYASHSWTPWFILGTATFAHELHRQLGRAPDAIVLPVGAGTLLLGIARGFAELRRQGIVEHIPRLYGVQSTGCAPLATAFEQGLADAATVPVGDTAAEGVKIARPPRGAQILAAVRESKGAVIAVGDTDLWAAFERLASNGVLVEPTSALAFAGAERLELGSSETVVVPVTATGLKTIGTVQNPAARTS
jgi:threonine synthase